MPEAVVPQLIERLLPPGSSAASSPHSVSVPPRWPPDLFAVCASILLKTGGYWRLRSRPALRRILERTYLDPLIAAYGAFDLENRIDADLSNSQKKEIVALWRTLLEERSVDFAVVADGTIEAALTLLLVADGACEGVGRANSNHPFATLIRDEHQRLLAQGRNELPHPHRSICRNVPLADARVLPKTLTPQLGQTVRILSDHLSLIDSREVETTWYFAEEPDQTNTNLSELNLLLVPFPYQIDGECFYPTNQSPIKILGQPRHEFQIDQLWLRDLNGGEGLLPFLSNLVKEAERAGEKVHGIVLPEQAISHQAANALADWLVATHPQLRFFVAGVGGLRNENGHILPVNACHVSIFVSGKTQLRWTQTKHHQWRLDRLQIEKYQLIDRLNPDHGWWESFDVSRECYFCSLNGGFAMTTLICEDLSRVEPTLHVIRAVGPNLVIALLMDDSQIRSRWSGACAWALAEDPGSSVLTLTSLGLIARSTYRDTKKPASIALWQSRTPPTEEVVMPWDCQAVLLKLSTSAAFQSEVALTAQRAIRIKDPPAWTQPVE
jgi:hypothetical protein